MGRSDLREAAEAYAKRKKAELAAEEKVTADMKAAVERAEKAAAAAGVTLTTPAGPLPLPAGWKEAKAADGRTYFFETATKKTQWTRPVPSAEELAAQLAPLPPGWKEAKAPDGRMYYFQPGGATHPQSFFY